MYFKNNRNQNIYYEIYGENNNKTIVFLHGNGEDLTTFYPLIKYFPNHKIILVDTISHGKSDKTIDYLDFHMIASDVIELIKYLNIDKIDNIVGYSDGGNTLLELLKNKCKIFSNYILISPNFNFKDIVYKFRLKIRWWRFTSKLKKKNTNLIDLLIDEPNFNISDFSYYDTIVNICMADHDIIKKNNLIKLCHIFNKELVLINNTTHLSIINNIEFINYLISAVI